MMNIFVCVFVLLVHRCVCFQHFSLKFSSKRVLFAPFLLTSCFLQFQVLPQPSCASIPQAFKKTTQHAEELTETQKNSLKHKLIRVSEGILTNPYIENYRINTQANVDVNKDADM